MIFKPKMKTVNIKVTKRQEEMVNLYVEAYGKACIWIKNGQVRILNPNEIIMVEGKIS